MKPTPSPQLLLGRNVVRLRGEAAWTQEKLAERADLSWRYVQEIESGSANASLAVLAQLRAAFRCNWDELLGGK